MGVPTSSGRAASNGSPANARPGKNALVVRVHQLEHKVGAVEDDDGRRGLHEQLREFLPLRLGQQARRLRLLGACLHAGFQFLVELAQLLLRLAQGGVGSQVLLVTGR